jgi:hypothetical protein
MNDADKLLQDEPGVGTDAPVSNDELAAMKNDLRDIASDIGANVVSQRLTNSDTRFCKWAGQADDGRKRKNSLGREAFPFEGASDTRVRLADKIINEHVQEYLTAATRAIPRVMGTDSADEAFAGRIGNLVKWLIKNQWGPDYMTELELLANWMEGDTPALSMLGVFWSTELAVESREVSSQTVLEQYIEAVAPQIGEAPDILEQAAAEMQAVFMDPNRIEEAAALLTGLYPNLTPKAARRAVRDIAEKGAAKLPVPYVRRNIPEIQALRMYEDVFVRANVGDIKTAPRVYLRRTLTRAEVTEWAARDEWDEDFVVELLGDDGKGKEGTSALVELNTDTNTEDIVTLYDTTNSMKGLYEVWWCYSRGVLSDGSIGIFVRVFSGMCSVPATPRRLSDDNTGRYPFVAFPRERLTRRLVDSRSVSELTLTQQNSLKLVADSVEDHVQVLTNPPIIKPRGSPKYSLCLTPFGEIEAGQRDQVRFLERPPYPVAAEKHREYIAFEIDDYFGRENAMVPEQRSLLARQNRINRFLGNLSEALMLAVQLCQRYMTDEDLQRIANTVWIGRSTKEIQGRFDLALSFDVRDLDAEYLVKKGEMLMKYARPLDTKATVPWEMMVRNMIEAIDPNWADMMPPADTVSAKVASDEQLAYMKIMTGLEPEMPEKIEAPQMRLQVLAEAHRPRLQNPQAFPPVSAVSNAMLQNRVKYLEQQATQEQNAVIGRVGAAPTDVDAVAAESQAAGVPT